MQLGKVHLPRTRIHHAEIASVQISQGEYYFSGRYKDFFPEGERSFFVGENWEKDMLKVAIYGKGGIGEIHSNFESGGSICYNGEKSHSDRL